MTVQVSTSALAILVIAGVVGIAVYRWSQQRTSAGVPQQRGDLGQAIGVGAAVGALLVAALAFPGDPTAADPAGPASTTPQASVSSSSP
ncbi:multisubunit Na+/H+ antiporter MnhB subunit [Streptomyces sp. V4I8]